MIRVQSGTLKYHDLSMKKNEMFVYGNRTTALPFWKSIISKNKVHEKGNLIWKLFHFGISDFNDPIYLFKKAMCDFMYLRLLSFCDGIQKCPFIRYNIA